jgi:hypothetical protein
MDSFFLACTVAAIGALILSLIISEKSKLGSKPFGLLAMRTGAERASLLKENADAGGKKKPRPKVGEALVRRAQGPKMPKNP